MKQKKQKPIKEEEVKEDNSTKINCACIQANDEYQYFLWTNVLFAMDNLNFSYLWDDERNENKKSKDDKLIIKYLIHLDIINNFFSSEKKLKAVAKLITLETLDEISDMIDPDPVAFSEEEVFLFTIDVLKSISRMFSEVDGAEEILIELKEPIEENTKLLTNSETKKTSTKLSNLN
jgi:hypothetical protein